MPSRTVLKYGTTKALILAAEAYALNGLHHLTIFPGLVHSINPRGQSKHLFFLWMHGFIIYHAL